MKRLFFILICLFSLHPGLHAQNSKFSLVAGANITGVAGSDVDDTKSRLGLQLGILRQAMLAEKIRVRYGLLYSNKGAKGEYSDTFEISEGLLMTYQEQFTVSTHYLDIPALFGFRVGPGLWIDVGPSFSFLVGNKIKYTSEECINGTCTGTQTKEKGDFRDIDMGMNFGLSFDIRPRISIAAAYQVGLLSIALEDAKVFNRVANFSLAFKL